MKIRKSRMSRNLQGVRGCLIVLAGGTDVVKWGEGRVKLAQDLVVDRGRNQLTSTGTVHGCHVTAAEVVG